MDTFPARKLRIKKMLEERAFVKASAASIVDSGAKQIKKSGWLFDVRAVMLEPAFMDDTAALFWETYAQQRRLQIGGMESAGIPLVAAMVSHAGTYSPDCNVSGFFIRKSRKKDGLMKAIEGTLRKDVPVILVDDLLNSGKSIQKQVAVLKDAGHDVYAVWTLIRFRASDSYRHLEDQGIKIFSLFSLDDFKDSLGTSLFQNPAQENEKPAQWKVAWRFKSEEPSHFFVLPKSDPSIDDSRVYFGTDSGKFFALWQSDGSVAWSFDAGSHKNGKGIFSSPALYKDTIVFGSYDGNVYALSTKTGVKKWSFIEADWIGSSPAIADDLGLVFIGLEFGLWRKHGGIAALKLSDGSKVWQDIMPCFTHSSPLYIRETGQVVIGSNDGAAYLYDAASGELAWRFETGHLTQVELETGFGERDIKESFAYNSKHDVILFGRMDGSFLSLDRKTGLLKNRFQAEYGIFSTPCIFEDTVIFTSLDKFVYCLDIQTFKEKWRWNADARIFSSPVIIDDTLYIGSNSGALTALNPKTGVPSHYFVVSERITNRVVQNEKTKRFFLPTCANEIYCLERRATHEGTN